jgi:hypothetical protein
VPKQQGKIMNQESVQFSRVVHSDDWARQPEVDGAALLFSTLTSVSAEFHVRDTIGRSFIVLFR